jgi:hypothetical protein
MTRLTIVLLMASSIAVPATAETLSRCSPQGLSAFQTTPKASRPATMAQACPATVVSLPVVRACFGSPPKTLAADFDQSMIAASNTGDPASPLE